MSPLSSWRLRRNFSAQATEAFRKAGAYIESAGGEGVVAIFGFPESDKQHAEKAARNAMTLTQAFSDSNRPGKSDVAGSVGVHAGVSSGIMIMATREKQWPARPARDRRTGGVGATILYRESLLRLTSSARAAHLRTGQQDPRGAARSIF